jgi:hypothetical protein
VTLFLLLAALAGEGRPLTLAPGQGNLYTAHWRDFPKVGWVASGELPVSSSPQLAGPMAGVVGKGSTVEVGGLGTPVPQPGSLGVLEEVLVLSLGEGPLHRAGYVLARGVAVFETIVARCSPSVVVFATVVGSRFVEGVSGMVLDLELWVRRGDALPSLVLAGTNQPPLETLPLSRGAAVALGGQVVVLDGQGSPVWRSPAGESWVLEGASGQEVRVRGASGASVAIGVPIE